MQAELRLELVVSGLCGDTEAPAGDHRSVGKERDRRGAGVGSTTCQGLRAPRDRRTVPRPLHKAQRATLWAPEFSEGFEESSCVPRHTGSQVLCLGFPTRAALGGPTGASLEGRGPGLAADIPGFHSSAPCVQPWSPSVPGGPPPGASSGSSTLGIKVSLGDRFQGQVCTWTQGPARWTAALMPRVPQPTGEDTLRPQHNSRKRKRNKLPCGRPRVGLGSKSSQGSF